MPRLFTAIPLPNEISSQLRLLQSGLDGARWIGAEDFHITLRFIGDVDNQSGNEVAEMLLKCSTPCFSLELRELDVFGKKKPHSLFARVGNSSQLIALKETQDRICRQLGIEPDGRKFTPHVTLARIRAIKPASVANYLSARGGFSSLFFNVNSFNLMSSRDSTGGGPYVVEQTYKLSDCGD